MTGQMVAAPSVQDLKHAIQRGDLTLTADTLALRIPTLQGQLPAQEGPAQPFEVRDFVLQADGQWSPQRDRGDAADAASAGESVRIAPHGAPPRGGFDARAL